VLAKRQQLCTTAPEAPPPAAIVPDQTNYHMQYPRLQDQLNDLTRQRHPTTTSLAARCSVDKHVRVIVVDADDDERETEQHSDA